VLGVTSINSHHWLLANTHGICCVTSNALLPPQTGLLGVNYYIFAVILWHVLGRQQWLVDHLQGMNGQLEFFNADDFEPMSAAEHFMCTDIEWDPTGRFVATSVGHVHQMENGFNLWLFNGTELYQYVACPGASFHFISLLNYYSILSQL